MPITGMNHAVLCVRDAHRTQRFFNEVLGFTTIVDHPGGAFVLMRDAERAHFDHLLAEAGVA